MNFPKFSLVIPTRNEVGNLYELIPFTYLFDEVIFVDGSSVDGTPELIQELFPQAILIHQGSTKGKGAAICIGLKNTSKDFVVILDADQPVSLSEVKTMKSIFERDRGLDLIKTSRHLPGGGSSDLTGIRKFGALFFAWLTRKVFRVNWTEMCYGFWGLSKKAIIKLQISDTLLTKKSFYPFNRIPYGLSFEFDQLLFLRCYKLDLNILEIPSYELERQNGESSLFAPFDGLRTLLTILRERF